MSEATGRKQEQFIIRFPDGMREAIRDAASGNGRSMNAEIVQRLETTFQMDVERSLMVGSYLIGETSAAQLRQEMQDMLESALAEILKSHGIDSGKAAE